MEAKSDASADSADRYPGYNYTSTSLVVHSINNSGSKSPLHTGMTRKRDKTYERCGGFRRYRIIYVSLPWLSLRPLSVQSCRSLPASLPVTAVRLRDSTDERTSLLKFESASNRVLSWRFYCHHPHHYQNAIRLKSPTMYSCYWD